jgi:hypothetical protein
LASISKNIIAPRRVGSALQQRSLLYKSKKKKTKSKSKKKEQFCSVFLNNFIFFFFIIFINVCHVGSLDFFLQQPEIGCLVSTRFYSVLRQNRRIEMPLSNFIDKLAVPAYKLLSVYFVFTQLLEIKLYSSKKRTIFFCSKKTETIRLALKKSKY